MTKQRRAREEAPGEWRVEERGWCLGDQAFKEELLAQRHEKGGDYHGHVWIVAWTWVSNCLGKKRKVV